jgi:hypothetical protein
MYYIKVYTITLQTLEKRKEMAWRMNKLEQIFLMEILLKGR